MAKKKKAEAKAKKAVPKQAEIPPLAPGDQVAVHLKIVEGGKERTQSFEGTVIKLRGAGTSKTFTIRKVSRGIGVERIFPVIAPSITKVEVKRHSRVRRAKLYYLRGRAGRTAQLREKRVEAQPGPETVET